MFSNNQSNPNYSVNSVELMEVNSNQEMMSLSVTVLAKLEKTSDGTKTI